MPSRTKLRHKKRHPSEDLLLEKVKSIVAPVSFVLSVESDFAGYFNTFGFTIQISENADIYELVVIENTLLAFFTSYFSENDLSFSWQVGIYCEEKLVRVIDHHSHERKICSICSHVFQDYLYEFCPNCYSKI